MLLNALIVKKKTKTKITVQVLSFVSAFKNMYQSVLGVQIMAGGRESKVTSAPYLSGHCYKLSFRCWVFISAQLAAADVITSPAFSRLWMPKNRGVKLSLQLTYQTLHPAFRSDINNKAFIYSTCVGRRWGNTLDSLLQTQHRFTEFITMKNIKAQITWHVT